MNILRGLILGGCVLAISACTNVTTHSEIEALNEVQAVGSPFTQALTSEYRAFANSEFNEMFDYPDALHFARKGLAAASGEVVMPEPITDWSLTPAHMEELGNARGRLLVSFDLGSRQVAPELTARAQAKFDCWIEQQEENWQATDIVGCKSQFLEAMGQLEGIVGTQVPTPAPEIMEPVTAAPSPSEPMKVEDAMYLVFFDFDRYGISSGAESVLVAVADEVRRRNLNAVRVIGHTDTSGPNNYNNRLAVRRANAVRDALVRMGVDASVIQAEGRGEEQLLVPTPDGVREPANRRAEITFR